MSEKNNNLVKMINENFIEQVKKWKENPDSVTEEVRQFLLGYYFDLCKILGLSEHSAWGVKWKIEKRNDEKDVNPFEVISGTEILPITGNVILNAGAELMLKLICGDSSATALNNTNAKIFVGTDETSESPEQTGVIATGQNRAYASMDSEYPKVSGRTATFRATFGSSTANFNWREISLANGTGVGAIAINRKVDPMGTKSGGTWSVELEISIVNA